MFNLDFYYFRFFNLCVLYKWNIPLPQLQSFIYTFYNFNLNSIDKAILTYWRWYTNDIGDNGNNDKWIVSISNNGGSTWQDLENTSISNASWVKQRFVINDYVDLSSDIIFKFGFN